MGALTACSAHSEPHSRLAESAWQFVSIDDASPTSDKAQLTFETDNIGATVGCNGMGGPWRIADDRIIAGPLIQTEIYCQGPIWAQEKAVSALLVGAPRFMLDGDTLVLKSSGHSARLRRIKKP
mgnify:CR=1 FL=1